MHGQPRATKLSTERMDICSIAATSRFDPNCEDVPDNFVPVSASGMLLWFNISATMHPFYKSGKCGKGNRSPRFGLNLFPLSQREIVERI